MVMEPIPNLADLIWALEAEPTWPDEASPPPWPYNGATWTLRRGPLLLSLYIHPGYEEVRLRITAAEEHANVVDLLLRQVRGVTLERGHDGELLRFDLRDDFSGGSLLLRVKPNLSVAWEVGAVV